jgi:hypothetical protein
MEIVCFYPNSHGFLAGEQVILLLRGCLNGEAGDSFLSVDGQGKMIPPNSLLMFAQIHGHIFVDFKWTKGEIHLSDIVSDESGHILHIDHPHSLPGDPSHQQPSLCTLTSTRTPISPTQLLECGVFVDSLIPACVFPSCKGRAVTIQYYLSIAVQSSTMTKTFHFPLTVHGQGPNKPCISRQ